MERQSFIDWLKAVGMLLIVIGHVGSPYSLFNLVSQPINTKQLGVCFFIFIMGWSLANEYRTSFKVVFNRVFPVYFYGVLFAILLSIVYMFTINDINESNYLPFMLGINVFFNHFPANPTTWYIGTYLHVLLFWFFILKGHPIKKWHLAASIITEISIRALLLYFNKDFIAYMTLPNWLTVFMLGRYLFQKKDTHWEPKSIVLVVVWVLLIAAWASPFNTLISSAKSFPFKELIADQMWEPFLRSNLISIVYLVNTYFAFELFRRLPMSTVVSFFARNSLITFIIHMPIIYAVRQDVFSYFDAQWSKRLVLIVLIFLGSALVSEVFLRSIKVAYFQSKAWDISSAIVAKFKRKKEA